MRAEILCVGSELLIGQTVNTNATWLSQRLAALGYDVHFQTVVGDNPGRIGQALAQAWQRADLLVITGGLGPTDDDLTHDAIATHFTIPLIDSPEGRRSVDEAMARWGRAPRPGQYKQALVPEGSEVLLNPAGSAPGIWLERDGHLVVTMPGVPREMEAIWLRHIEPRLARRQHDAIVSHLLKFVGIPESLAAREIQDLMAGSNPTVAPCVTNGELHLRLTAKAADQASADALLQPVMAEILDRLGDFCFGQDEETLEGLVIQALRDRHETVAVAESVTGGWLAQRLTNVPGASAAFGLGVVTYNDAMKTQVTGVPADVLIQHGAVSDAVARAMAEGVRQVAGADWGIGITGLAGPAGDDRGTPVGRVYVAVAGPGFADCKRLDLGTTGRENVRWQATQAALRRLQRALGR